MKHTSFDDFFTVLANKQRVKILQLLNKEGSKSLSNIANKHRAEQSAVSHKKYEGVAIMSFCWSKKRLRRKNLYNLLGNNTTSF